MYGETGATMRHEVATLLRQHRVQQRLGGSTPEAREELGVLIRGYRQNILTWLSQAMRAATPLTFTNMPPAQPNPFRSVRAPSEAVTPAAELARAVELARTESTAHPASFDALATPVANAMVEHWRRAARAAALAEHDTSDEFAAKMTANQAQALVGDVAALTQGLVVLDQRCRNTPGWESLAQSPRLGWAALAAALDVNLGQPDYAVDRLGWRPKTKIIHDPVRPGILGVLQAQHNLVIRMSSAPTATNLRLVVDSQRLLSTHLVSFASRIDRGLAQRWAERADTYGVVQQQLREVGGQLGHGSLAVAEGSHAVARLRSISADSIVEPRVLSAFQVLFDRLDHRIADIIEEGVAHGAYFKRITLPSLDVGDGRLVHPRRERFVPVATATDLAVIRTIRQRLRPRDPLSPARPDSTRVDLHSALIHRPTSKGASDGPRL